MARILYFSRDFTSHDYRFLSALAETEHKVFYLRLEQRGHAQEDRPLPYAIEQVIWAGGCSPAHGQDGPRLLLDLQRVLRRVQPDLVQAGPLQRAAFLTALSGFRPLVSMSWGYDLLFDAQRNRLWRAATRYTLRRSAALVVDCQTIQQRAVSLGMPPERIVSFPWGVDLVHFSPVSTEGGLREKLGWGKDLFVLLSTRSWEPIYGVTTLARAFVQAAQTHPELRLVMLGNGSQAAELRQIFDRGQVEDRVYFPGQVSQQDLPRYYRVADLYVSASHSDGTSISLLEALACGTPVLVSDIPGNREWVTMPGEVGWLFPDGDVQALAAEIVQVIAERSHLSEVGQQARRLAEARADWNQNFRKLFQAYEIAQA